MVEDAKSKSWRKFESITHPVSKSNKKALPNHGVGVGAVGDRSGAETLNFENGFKKEFEALQFERFLKDRVQGVLLYVGVLLRAIEKPRGQKIDHHKGVTQA